MDNGKGGYPHLGVYLWIIYTFYNFEYYPHFRIILGIRHTEISNDPGVSELTEIDE